MAEQDPVYKEYWTTAWGSDKALWAGEDRHVWLTKDNNVDALLKGRANLTIFITLCGDSPDMKWLGDLGHTIIGVDIGKEAFEKFFKKHNIEYTIEPVASCNGTLYKSKDNKYRLYCCDFFEFSHNVEGKVDAIFDSAAMMAIHSDMRKKYADIIVDMMKDDAVCILEAVNFIKICWEGPPFEMKEQELRDAFETKCKVEKIDNYIFTIPGGDGDHESTEDGDTESEIMPCDMYSITLKK